MSAISTLSGRTPQQASRLVRMPPRRSSAVRAQASLVQSVAPPLLASAHYLLKDPTVLAGLSVMAAAAVVSRLTPPKPFDWELKPLSSRPPQPPPAGPPVWQKAAAAALVGAMPAVLLLATRAGMQRFGVVPGSVPDAAVMQTLAASMAGMHVAFNTVGALVNAEQLDPAQGVRALLLACPTAGLAAPVAYQTALALRRNVHHVPVAVLCACYAGSVGRQVGLALADHLQKQRAPLWAQNAVLQSATWGAAIAGGAGALAWGL